MTLPIHKAKPCRSNNINPSNNYRSYKEQLRSDFNRCCGYCGDDDFSLGGRRGFHIDHFAPKSIFPHLETTYSNLVYGCPFCNIAKSNDWPSNDENKNIVDDQGYIDPCNEEFDSHLQRDLKGQIVPVSNTGYYMYNKLKLYLLRHRLCWAISELASLIHEFRKLGLDEKPEYKALLENHFDFIEQLRNEQ